MPELNDCYVLAPERSGRLALRFLERFLPCREPSFAPEDPSEVLGVSPTCSLEQILQHLEAEPARDYSMYFRNERDTDPLHAAVMFNGDGSLFLMLSVDASGGDAVASQFLDQLKEFSAAGVAYWGWEEQPAISADAFRQRAGTTNDA
jgi:hypothetical protein